MAWTETTNCIKYAYEQKGLPVPPNPFDQIVTIPELKRFFETAIPEEADTIAILGRYYGDIGVVHMAIRDQSGLFVHVPHLGGRPKQVKPEELVADRSHSTSIHIWRGENLVNMTPPEHKVWLRVKNTVNGV